MAGCGETDSPVGSMSVCNWYTLRNPLIQLWHFDNLSYTLSLVGKDVSSRMFIAVLFKMVKNWRQPTFSTNPAMSALPQNALQLSEGIYVNVERRKI